MTNSGPFSRARCDISISATAMIGTGLSATPTARGRICPMAAPITLSGLVSYHAAEAEMTGCSVDRLRHPGGRAVAAAVVRRAQVRSALHDLARDARWILSVNAAYASRPATAGGGGVGMTRVPVRCPLPDVADHVVHAVAVGRERADRGGPLVPVVPRVLDRELTLPGVRHPGPV